MRVLYVDHKESAEDNAIFLYEGLKSKIPSLDMTIKNEYFSDGIPNGYDFYFLHLSSTNVDAIEELKRENPSACIIGMSDMCSVIKEVPSVLEGMLDAYVERSASDRNLERLTGIIKSRLQ